jgi:hypothetical protein
MQPCRSVSAAQTPLGRIVRGGWEAGCRVPQPRDRARVATIIDEQDARSRPARKERAGAPPRALKIAREVANGKGRYCRRRPTARAGAAACVPSDNGGAPRHLGGVEDARRQRVGVVRLRISAADEEGHRALGVVARVARHAAPRGVGPHVPGGIAEYSGYGHAGSLLFLLFGPVARLRWP